jgi:hypothetical protein
MDPVHYRSISPSTVPTEYRTGTVLYFALQNYVKILKEIPLSGDIASFTVDECNTASANSEQSLQE